MATKTKTPQDRKLSTEERQLEFNEMEGADLLVPFSKIKGSDQARLYNRLLKLMDGLTDNGDITDIALSDIDLDALADFIDFVGEKHAVNTAAFERFTAGPGGFTRATELVFAFANEAGKDAA